MVQIAPSEGMACGLIQMAGSYLKWIVASKYYDGVMERVGERTADGATVWFRALAWDDEQWRRVFAVAVIGSSLTRELLREIEKVERPRSPFWLPGASVEVPTVQNAWDEIVASALDALEWSLVEAHDLLEPATEHALSTFDRSRISKMVSSNEFFEFSGCQLTAQVLQRISQAQGGATRRRNQRKCCQCKISRGQSN